MNDREYQPFQASRAMGLPTAEPVVPSNQPMANATLSNAVHDIQRLRRWLSQQRTEHQQAIEKVRRDERHQAAGFRHRAAELITKAEEQTSKLESQLAAQAETHERDREQWSSEIDRLKSELKNVADTAAETQKTLEARSKRDRDQLAQQLSRASAQLKRQVESAKQTETSCRQLHQQLGDWKSSHAAAVELAAMLQKIASATREKSDRQRQHSESRTQEALECRSDAESEVSYLNDQVALLESDHLDLALVTEALDHQLSLKDHEIECLRHQLETVFESSRISERYFEGLVIDLEKNVADVQTQLVTSLTEKSTLIESVSRLQAEIDQHDANLFAKDQEVAATAKQRREMQAQLDQMRREKASLEQVVAELQNTCRDQSTELEQTRTEFQAAESKCASLELQRDELMEAKASIEADLRNLETSARAAEANSLLVLNETEQQFQVQLQAMEAQIHDQSRPPERVSDESDRRPSVTSENDDEVLRIRHELSQAEEQVLELRTLLDDRDRQITNLETQVRQRDDERLVIERLRSKIETSMQAWASTREKLCAAEAETGQLQFQLASAETQETPDLESLRSEIDVDLEGLWTRRIGQLQQQMLEQRERDHQSNLELKEQISRQTEQLTVAQTEYAHLLDEYRETRETTERLLHERENPPSGDGALAELKRLSRELALHRVTSSRERESLLQRIDELQDFRNRRAA